MFKFYIIDDSFSGEGKKLGGSGMPINTKHMHLDVDIKSIFGHLNKLNVGCCIKLYLRLIRFVL